MPQTKKKERSWTNFIFPTILFFFLIFTYKNYTRTLLISYWDEIAWVGRSYFFQFYIKGDFQNKIWKSFASYDQPQFTSYVYGAWIYPLYLQEKRGRDSSYD